MGRYRPPESLDSALVPASKRARTAKSWQTPAQPTIRFEMPFAIWCQTCPAHAPARLIGQGVRFNARKTRVGAYHSTPIWAFELKHTACGGRIEIRTDPANHDFVVTEGARKRDTGDDAVIAERTGGMLIEGGGMVRTREEEERAQAREDAFVAFEGKKADKERGENMAKRLEVLRSVKERDWRDPDEANRRLRKTFRGVRRDRDKDRERGEALADTMGFGFELLEGSEADTKRARLVEFGAPTISSDPVESKPLFLNARNAGKAGSHTSSSQTLHEKLSRNTRATMDPFTGTTGKDTSGIQLQALRNMKKKNQESSSEDSQASKPKDTRLEATANVLVEYDSD